MRWRILEQEWIDKGNKRQERTFLKGAKQPRRLVTSGPIFFSGPIKTKKTIAKAAFIFLPEILTRRRAVEMKELPRAVPKHPQPIRAVCAATEHYRACP
jgi:hypothetical protein